ncbi:putative transporter [Fusarium oxysporum f. sp. rapae]|uniref:Putative transporter n=1 Tax=Fusarium oxysporum f. sp. rapae TaxID=485398 RepID=A0A8J5NX45_FUSOX|nr:putative transporter [Fusarium oxysporum f. sp. rapae]
MASSPEKHAEDAASEQVEYAVGSVQATDMNNLSDRVRMIRRKVDMRLCIIIAVMYTVCQIDRQNPAYAVVAGMGEDIDLSGMNYRRGFFPSSVFLISTWYVRHEVAIRIAFFYLFGNVLGGFGGVLAYGLQQMHGLAGYEGWRWIFITEGVVTALLGGDAHSTEFSLRAYLENAIDWKVWILAINFDLTSMVIYAVAYFLPIVLRDGLGFSVVEAQTLNAPCYVFGGILGLTESWLSDKYKLRGPFIMLNSILEIIGLSLLGFHHENVVRYIGTYFVVGGANACLALTLTYQSNNIVGQWRRAFCSAVIVGMGGIGGIIASLVFRGQDKPGYRPGLYPCLIAASLTFISVCFTTVVFRSKNQLQKEGKLVIEKTDGFTYTL